MGIIIGVWMLGLALAIGLCAAARMGDAQLGGTVEPPQVAAHAAHGPQTSPDLVLQSG